MTNALEKNTVTDCLISFGLTRQEAVIYETLLAHGEMTGYEVSKETGISRSNAYASLAGLADKGAAYLIKAEAVKYTPVPVPQFVESSLASLAEKGEFLKANAPARRDSSEGYITIQGAANIRGKIRQMLADMEHRLYLMASSDIVAQFAGELSEQISGGKKVVLLTDALPSELAGTLGAATQMAKSRKTAAEPPTVAAKSQRKVVQTAQKEQVASAHNDESAGATTTGGQQESAVYVTDAEPGQIRLIVDSAYVLTGEFTGSESDTCLYSGQKNLVSVMKEALKNKITLLAIGG